MLPFNKDVEFILGRPNFVCGGIARQLRECGKEIPEKAEAEQAAVIYFLLEMYEKHGDNWNEAAVKWVKDNQSLKQTETTDTADCE